MLRKKNRIRLKKDFDQAFKSGQSFYSKFIGVKVIPNDLLESRFGILINTKVSKKAVVRNKLRRQIRGIIEKNIEKLDNNNDFVIIVLPEVLKKSTEDIEEFLVLTFKRTNKTKNSSKDKK